MRQTNSRSYAGKPWRNHQMNQQKPPPTMLLTDELTLLHWLTSNYYTGKGDIIDAGCFLGGSSVALADGLAQNSALRPEEKGNRITSYDLFVVDQYAKNNYLQDETKQLGEDFLDLYLFNIAHYSGYINVVQGDIREIKWENTPIEILFLDVLKQPDINNILVQKLFRHLIPGLSIVVQQDYVHEWLPWIHVTMEYFAEYFEILDYFYGGSAVYRLLNSIPTDLCTHFAIENIPPDVQVAYMDAAIHKTPEDFQDIVKLAKVRLLYYLGRKPAAQELLNSLKHNDSPRVLKVAGDMKIYFGLT